MTYALPGRAGPSPTPRRPPVLPLLLLGAVLLVPLVVVLLEDSAANMKVQSIAPLVDESLVESDDGELHPTSDVRIHAAHLRDKLIEISNNQHAAQRRIRQVAPDLRRNFLTSQVRHLESADAYIEKSRRETEEAIEELAMILDYFKEPQQ